MALCPVAPVASTVPSGRNTAGPSSEDRGSTSVTPVLPAEDQTLLAKWLSERDWLVWDEQIERDFSPGGRGTGLLAELEREIAEGATRPMEEGLAERRKSRR